LLLALACAGLAQNLVPPATVATDVYPWARYTYESCFYYQDFQTGEYYRAGKDIPVFWVSDYSQGSGYHAHDQGNRPRITLFDSDGHGGQSPLGFYNMQNLTNADGCAYVVGQFPDIGGVFRVQIFTPFMGTSWEKHIDNVAKVWSRQGNSVDVRRDLEPLEFNADTMKPFSLHTDPQHTNLTRWVTYNSKPVFQLIADSYVSLQASLPVVPFVRDKLDFQRCSLPAGGISDNDFNATTGQQYNWTTRVMEHHDRGIECDIANPSTYVSDPAWVSQFQGLILPAVVANGCRFGAFAADGPALSSIISYWNQQPYYHVVCQFGAISRNPLPGQ